MFERLSIPDVIFVTPKRHGDARGFFSETYRADAFADAGITGPFVQDNHAYSQQPGILRGLHFQKPPVAQAKLVRCTQGAIYDVAVDLVQTSCGYAVPFYDYAGEREVLADWAADKGPEGIDTYWRTRNQATIDGAPTHILADPE